MDITIKWGSVLLVAAAVVVIYSKLNDVQEEVQRKVTAGQQHG